MVKLFISTVLSVVLFACGNRNAKTVTNYSVPGSASTNKSSKPSVTAINTVNAEYFSLIPAGNMQTPRAAHTATLLKNGTVLICGGFMGNTSLSSAEIYHPVSKTFTPVQELEVARSGHSACLMPDGKVLIAGGFNGNYLESTEIFDPETNTFSRGPDMTVARSGHTATDLRDNKVLFAGGVGTGWTFLSSAEIFDITLQKFLPTGLMTIARESHTATLLTDGNVLITGGHRGRRENVIIYRECEQYDSKSGRFRSAGKLDWPRHKHDAVLLANGTVFIIGGADQRDGRGVYSTAEIFDPGRSRSTSMKNMQYPRYKLNGTSILLPGNNVLIAGGASMTELYHFATAAFQSVQGSMESARLFSTATMLRKGDVLITGGYDEDNKTSDGAWLVVKKAER